MHEGGRSASMFALVSAGNARARMMYVPSGARKTIWIKTVVVVVASGQSIGRNNLQNAVHGRTQVVRAIGASGVCLVERHGGSIDILSFQLTIHRDVVELRTWALKIRYLAQFR